MPNKNAANETTMTYLGELRYDGNEKAQKLYSELVKWNIESFVNSSEKILIRDLTASRQRMDQIYIFIRHLDLTVMTL